MRFRKNYAALLMQRRCEKVVCFTLPVTVLCALAVWGKALYFEWVVISYLDLYGIMIK